MKAISLKRLTTLLQSSSRSQFVSFVAITDPAMRKRENPFLGARKVSLVNGVINWQYSVVVNRQRAREGHSETFKPEPRKWGTRLKNTPLVSHESNGTETLYLEVKVERRTQLYFDRETAERIDDNEIAPFLFASGKSDRQELDKEIALRDYRLECIAEITLAGTQYRIAPAAVELQHYLPAPKPAAAKATARRRTK